MISQPKQNGKDFKRCPICGEDYPKETRRKTCSEACHAEFSRKASDRSKRQFKHDWLPDDDEANVFGFWVPPPEELKKRMEEVRAESQ